MPLRIPKTTQVHKKVKTPSKLAVRKNIRRSSVWDKKPTLPDDSFIANTSTNSFRTKENRSLKDSIIVIDSDSDANEDVNVNIVDELYEAAWKRTNKLIYSEPHYYKTLKLKTATLKPDIKSKKQLKNNVGKHSNKNITETTSCLKKILQENNSSKETIENAKVKLFQSNTKNLPKSKLQEKTNKDVKSPRTLRLKYLCDSESSDEEEENQNDKIRIKLDSSDLSSSNDSDNSYSEKSDVLFIPSEDEVSRSDSEASFILNEISENYKKVSAKKPQVSVCESFLASLSAHVPSDKCDPSARFFKATYKTNKVQLAEKLFQLYNEKIFNALIPKDTPIEWNKNMRKTGGRCHQRTKKLRTGEIERTVKISLSVKVLDEPHRLRDVLLHEMCHAACFLINKVMDGHGEIFKSWGRKAEQIFPELPPVKRCHSYKINTKYSYRCLNCGYCYNRHSKSIDMKRKCCGKCRGKFELLVNKSANGEQKSVPVSTLKPPSGFALFVKNNYAAYKTPELKHGEIMKLLGSKFTELKVSDPKVRDLTIL